MDSDLESDSVGPPKVQTQETQNNFSFREPRTPMHERVVLAPLAAVTPSTPACSSSQGDNMGKAGLSHMYEFLKSCSPPLGHLLSRFVNLGFKSPDILKEVSSNLTRDERIEVLRKLQVPLGSQGGEVSEVELVALERRFQKYYLDISNGM
jgi:hypothetical protein